jgi:hypothetical protein
MAMLHKCFFLTFNEKFRIYFAVQHFRNFLVLYVLLLGAGGASEIAFTIIPVIEAAGGKVLVRANVTGQGACANHN